MVLEFMHHILRVYRLRRKKALEFRCIEHRHSPWSVLYGVGKCFCLRGGQEHRDLTLSHFKRLKDPDRYVYCEHVSKNRPGGLDLIKLDHKSASIVANPEVGENVWSTC